MTRSRDYRPGQWLLGLILSASIYAQADIQAYKVERVVSPRSDTYGDNPHGLGPALAQIEIAAIKHEGKPVPLPSRENFQQLLLIDSKGITTETIFYEFEKRCEFLCGDELEECHHTALIGWNQADIGVPLLAVAGLAGIDGKTAGVRDFVAFTEQETTLPPSFSVPEQPLLWPEENFLGITSRAGDSQFSIRYGVKKPYRYTQPDKQCRWTPYPQTALRRLACSGTQVLLENQTPLLFSNPDYNLPNAQLVNRFRVGEQDYSTVMLALKAYTAYGLLTKVQGKWRFIARPADWARLC